MDDNFDMAAGVITAIVMIIVGVFVILSLRQCSKIVDDELNKMDQNGTSIMQELGKFAKDAKNEFDKGYTNQSTNK